MDQAGHSLDNDNGPGSSLCLSDMSHENEHETLVFNVLAELATPMDASCTYGKAKTDDRKVPANPIACLQLKAMDEF